MNMSILTRFKEALETFRTSTLRSNATHLGNLADEALAAKLITPARYRATFDEIAFWLDPLIPLVEPL
jgi:hypothetical protein